MDSGDAHQLTPAARPSAIESAGLLRPQKKRRAKRRVSAPQNNVALRNPYSIVEFWIPASGAAHTSAPARAASIGSATSLSPILQVTIAVAPVRSTGVTTSQTGFCPNRPKKAAITYGSTPPYFCPQ